MPWFYCLDCDAAEELTEEEVKVRGRTPSCPNNGKLLPGAKQPHPNFFMVEMSDEELAAWKERHKDGYKPFVPPGC